MTTSSYCFSPTRNPITHSNFLLLNSNLYLPKQRNHNVFTQEPKKDFILKTPKSSFSLLTLKSHQKPTHPFASLSSFAENHDGQGSESTENQENQENVKESDLPGMAQAFHISSSTASAISICIAVAALALPFFMKSLAQGMGLKIKLLSYATLLFGFFMAWNIGANDVANAMGTSVGSGALSLRQAVLTAAVLEFSGALLMGRHVTVQCRKGFLWLMFFKGRILCFLRVVVVVGGRWYLVTGKGYGFLEFFVRYCWNLISTRLGLVMDFWYVYVGTSFVSLAALLESDLTRILTFGVLAQVASFYGWPVSTTHCIVGSMVGFGLVYGGRDAVFWSSLARVASSWVISPLIGAAVSFLVYKCIRRFVYSAPNPGQAAAAAAPIAVFLGVTAITLTAFPLSTTLPIALAQSLGCGALGAFIVNNIIRKQLGHLLAKANSAQHDPHDDPNPKTIGFLSDIAGPTGTHSRLSTACSDTCRSSPPASCRSPTEEMTSRTRSAPWLRSLHPTGRGHRGLGRVRDRCGAYDVGVQSDSTSITELTPTRGFAAEFAAASVVLFASKLGLPISATHTLVGAVMGGRCEGGNREGNVTSWVVTIPVGAMFAVIYTWIFTRFL
ncbi:LOW QUALITY PROTEIN: hypothetical protein OSB04_018510, partial [Centaurea solstitialis]